jgi:hypothetical protein
LEEDARATVRHDHRSVVEPLQKTVDLGRFSLAGLADDQDAARFEGRPDIAFE